MPGRGEISWKSRTPEGERREISAQRRGHFWTFHVRKRRFDNWTLLKDPSLEDWLTLLDGVERRVPRKLCDPQEPARVRQLIRHNFPDADI